MMYDSFTLRQQFSPSAWPEYSDTMYQQLLYKTFTDKNSSGVALGQTEESLRGQPLTAQQLKAFDTYHQMDMLLNGFLRSETVSN